MTEVRFFSTKPYDRRGFEAAGDGREIEIEFLEARLDRHTVRLAAGAAAICAFVNDDLSEPVLAALAEGGTTIVALRCAGFNNVDVDAARRLRSHRRAGALVLAERSGRAHDRPDAHPQPAHPSSAQPGARRQLLARRAGRVRHGRQDRGGDRHRQDRRRSSLGCCGTCAAT